MSAAESRLAKATRDEFATNLAHCRLVSPAPCVIWPPGPGGQVAPDDMLHRHNVYHIVGRVVKAANAGTDSGGSTRLHRNPESGTITFTEPASIHSEDPWHRSVGQLPVCGTGDLSRQRKDRRR